MLQVFGENRHRCFGCGSCCYGHAIGLLDEAEEARIRDAGEKLAVADPVVDGGLRFERSRCVFQDPSDRLCRIHKELGYEVKPLACQLWPLKLVKADGELRFGLDPGCVNTWRSWQTGEVQETPERMIARPGALSPQEQAIEAQLLGLASADLSIAGMLRALSGAVPSRERPAGGDELPAGMAERFVVRLQAIRMGQLLGKDEFGAGLVEPLAHLPAAFDALDRRSPPGFAGLLTVEQDAFAREIVRRKLWLREAPVQPATHGLFVLTALGVVACAWADPRPEVFGPALSAWTRLMRFQAFWLRVAPELETVRWLCTGAYDGELGAEVVIGSSPAP